MRAKVTTLEKLRKQKRVREGLYFLTDTGEYVRFGKVETEDGDKIQWQVEDEQYGIVRWGEWGYSCNAEAVFDYFLDCK